MKILIAVDSFKGSLSSMEAVQHIARGIRQVLPGGELVMLPIADGGEGTMEAFLSAVGGKAYTATVKDPLGRNVDACYGILPDGTAVIEMAQASGLMLLKEDELDPLHTSTYGTGELIRIALDGGCRRFIIGLGGSATNDGGTGMARALGVRFLDDGEKELEPGGAALARLERLDVTGLDARLKESTFLIANDVTNILCGPQGATAIYGPQKGVGEKELPLLDGALDHYAQVVKNQLGKDVARRPGSGAAGGLGAGLMVFCDATVSAGIQLILDAVHFEALVKDADLVITGEGRIDAQSLYGKVPSGVAKRTKAAKDIPVIAVVGCIGPGAEAVYDAGIDAIYPIADRAMSLKESMEEAGTLLQAASARMIRLLQAGNKIRF